MKLLTTAILSSAIALSSMAAAGTDNPTVAKKKPSATSASKVKKSK